MSVNLSANSNICPERSSNGCTNTVGEVCPRQKFYELDLVISSDTVPIAVLKYLSNTFSLLYKLSFLAKHPLHELSTFTFTITENNMSNEKDPVLRSISESKAEYKRLGNTGLLVSVPILGAMSFGHKDCQEWVIEENEALPLLKAAYDRGLNTWDTANVSCPICESVRKRHTFQNS